MNNTHPWFAGPAPTQGVHKITRGDSSTFPGPDGCVCTWVQRSSEPARLTVSFSDCPHHGTVSA